VKIMDPFKKEDHIWDGGWEEGCVDSFRCYYTVDGSEYDISPEYNRKFTELFCGVISESEILLACFHDTRNSNTIN